MMELFRIRLAQASSGGMRASVNGTLRDNLDLLDGVPW